MAPIPLVAERSKEIADLCRKHQVQRLDLFGSAATGHFDPNSSNLDFPVIFRPEASAMYVGLCDLLYTNLHCILNRPIDPAIETDFNNPYFRDAANESRTPVYVAWS